MQVGGGVLQEEPGPLGKFLPPGRLGLGRAGLEHFAARPGHVHLRPQAEAARVGTHGRREHRIPEELVHCVRRQRVQLFGRTQGHGQGHDMGPALPEAARRDVLRRHVARPPQAQRDVASPTRLHRADGAAQREQQDVAQIYDQEGRDAARHQGGPCDVEGLRGETRPRQVSHHQRCPLDEGLGGHDGRGRRAVRCQCQRVVPLPRHQRCSSEEHLQHGLQDEACRQHDGLAVRSRLVPGRVHYQGGRVCQG
mmetsp:Transcript_15941/g.41223  ORF Transcript_15941/g.41223 Transcript_15941/m.41223 type:complete len:252 (+) Transcript_15941:673-1428(+)